MASSRQSIISHLQSYTTLTSLLGDGSSSIITSGVLSARTKTPCVLVRRGAVMRSPAQLPWYTELWECRVYWSSQSHGGARWPEIDTIMGHVRGRLHDASLSVDDGTLWSLKWDGFESPDMWDWVHKMNFRTTRFRAYRSISYW